MILERIPDHLLNFFIRPRISLKANKIPVDPSNPYDGATEERPEFGSRFQSVEERGAHNALLPGEVRLVTPIRGGEVDKLVEHGLSVSPSMRGFGAIMKPMNKSFRWSSKAIVIVIINTCLLDVRRHRSMIH